jgi:hypothetical protein
MSTAAWEYEHSVECAADRSFVWAYWTDVSNWERIEGDAVESIRLEGPFAVGTRGVTKTPGQEPREWVISKVTPEISATIEMPLDGALFTNHIKLDSLSDDRTRITQRMALEGEMAHDLAKGMRPFEATAPQGLAKLALAIEAARAEAQTLDTQE